MLVFFCMDLCTVLYKVVYLYTFVCIQVYFLFKLAKVMRLRFQVFHNALFFFFTKTKVVTNVFKE